MTRLRTRLLMMAGFLIIGGLVSVLNSCGGGGGGGSSPSSTTSNTATITGTIPPTVVAKSTDGSSCAVDTGAAISVTFSSDMTASSITNSTFTISEVSGTVTYNSSTKIATFTPSTALAEGTAYTAMITTGAKDSAGNGMANNFAWSFTTKVVPTGTTAVNPSYLMGGSIQGNSLNLTNVNAVTPFAEGFLSTHGITTDGTNLYVADSGNRTIRKIVISTGVVTTLAGTAGSYGSTDGTGSEARFSFPMGITTDGTNLYVADSGNHTIRKIVMSTGVVTTLAGSADSSGSTDGTGSAARFYSPSDITTDGTNLYVVDARNYTIRKIVISTGVVTTLAGTAGSSGSIDGTGSAARFFSPNGGGVTTDGTNLFVADSFNYTIRKIVISTGVVTTLAGTAGNPISTDGTGSAAGFTTLNGITTDGTNLFVATDGNTILVNNPVSNSTRRVVISTGVVTTLVLTGSSGITTDGTNLFVGDNNTIRKISAPTTAPSSFPTGLTATTGDGQATISWDSVSGAACYNLYFNGTAITSIASPYTYTGLTNGTTYSFYITAVNSYGESAPSSPVALTPAATHTLSVSVSSSNNGSGTVTSSPSGINCGSTCTATVTSGATVTLTATPVSGSTFTGWSGACSGTGSCVVTMDANKTVTATFATSTQTLQTFTGPFSGTGSIPSGISCPFALTYSGTINLSLTPQNDGTFTGTAHVSGNVVATSSATNCIGGTYAYDTTSQLSGMASNLTWTSSLAVGTGTFTGSLNGNSITGTVDITGPVGLTGSGSFALTKQ